MNLNECEENSLENINEEIRNAKYVEVSNKLDGTMISARWTNFLDEFPVMVATQKNTDEDISYQISEAKRMLYDNYIKKIGKQMLFYHIQHHSSMNQQNCLYLEQTRLQLINPQNFGLIKSNLSCNTKKWYFGHYHGIKKKDKMEMMYNNISEFFPEREYKKTLSFSSDGFSGKTF